MTQPNDDIEGEKLVEKGDLSLTTTANNTQTTDVDNPEPEVIENSIILATRALMREFGIRKSGASIRDAVENSHDKIGPEEAVGALSNLGFKASFGSLKIEKLSDDFFPLIAFKKTGEAVLIASPILDKKISITDPMGGATSQITTSNFKDTFSQYFIIVKELNEREKKERSGHWFFSSFRKSKWIYVQVMIAAMVSNFLSLSTALFLL